MNGSAKPRTLAPVRPMRNEDVSQALEEVGDLLESQQANPFRAMAYRHAADSVRRLEQPVADMLAEGGIAALTQLPGVGESLARVIAEICETGRLGLIERLRGEVSAETLLATVPGVGAELAKRSSASGPSRSSRSRRSRVAWRA